MPELKYNQALSKAAIDHANDIDQFGLTGHEDIQRQTYYLEKWNYIEIKNLKILLKVLLY